MSDFSVQLEGFDRAQAAMLRGIEAMKSSGAMGDAVKRALLMAQEYAAQITDQDTGTLSRSHVIQYAGTNGFVYPSPSNINPRSHKPASYYAIFEENRGGQHAFYGRTVADKGQQILEQAGLQIIKAFD